MFGAGDFVLLLISKYYKSRCDTDILNNIENTLYHSFRKLFLVMSISIEIEKDLKMHVFLAKTKNVHFCKLSCFKKFQESTSVYFLKCYSDYENNNSYLKEISIFSSFFLVLNLCWWVQVKCWWVLLQCW